MRIPALALAGSLLRFPAWPLRRRPAAPVAWPAADAFYRSYGWRRLRVDMLEANRERYGIPTRECCLATATRQWHVDYARPCAQTHPALALEPANLQVLCQDCNLGKSTRYATDCARNLPEVLSGPTFRDRPAFDTENPHYGE